MKGNINDTTIEMSLKKHNELIDRNRFLEREVVRLSERIGELEKEREGKGREGSRGRKETQPRVGGRGCGNAGRPHRLHV